MENRSGTIGSHEAGKGVFQANAEAVNVPFVSESAKAQGLKQLGALSLSFYFPVFLLMTGMALLSTWEEIFFIGSVLVPASGGSVHWLFILCKAVSFLLCAFIASRKGVFNLKKPLYLVIGLCFIVSAGCMLLSVAFPSCSHPLMLVGAALGGFGIGAITTKWFEICRYFSPFVVVVAFILSSLMALFFMLSSYSISFEILAGVGLLLPVAAILCVFYGFKLAQPEQDVIRGSLGSYPSMRMLVVLVAVFGFAFAFKEPTLGNDIFQSGSYTAFGATIVEIVVLYMLFSQRFKHGLLLIFQIVFPLTAIVFLFLSSDLPLMQLLSDFCSAVSDQLVSILAVIVISSIVYKFKASPAQLFGFALGIKFVAVFAGEAAWLLLGNWDIGEGEIETFFGIVAAAAIATTTIVCSYRGIFASLDVGLFEARSASDPAKPSHANAENYRAIVQSKGLTPREEDVLLLMLEGKSYKEIEDELCISKETAKTHRQNIFRKCGVHSREELMLVLEGQ